MPRIGMAQAEIQEMIESIPILSEVQKMYYIAVLKSRYENVLLPVCRKQEKKEQDIGDAGKEGRCR